MTHGVTYVLAKNNSIVALDAATGKEIWTHAPEPDTKVITNRGINYWESKDAAATGGCSSPAITFFGLSMRAREN